jgi:hypothetical protein
VRAFGEPRLELDRDESTRTVCGPRLPIGGGTILRLL